METERKKQSDLLMKRMKQKSLKAQQQQQQIITGLPVKQRVVIVPEKKKEEKKIIRKPMILLLDQLRERESSRLFYQAPELIVQLLREESAKCQGGGGGRILQRYLERKSLQPLWSIQESAIQFAKSRESDRDSLCTRGYMLCDEMSLGKSRTLLSVVLEQNQSAAQQSGKRFNGPTLIVCSDLLISNWLKELEVGFPPQTFYYHILSSLRDDSDLLDSIRLYHCCDLVFTTYATVSHDFQRDLSHRRRALLFETHWRRIVADEAHIMVNELTDITQAMCALSAESKAILTGTPTQNHQNDILTLMKFIGYHYPQRWENCNSSLMKKEVLPVLSHLMMRRMKSDLESSLSTPDSLHNQKTLNGPTIRPVYRHLELVEFMTKPEKLLYYLYASLALQRKKTQVENGLERMNITHVIQIMKQLCTSPALVKNLILPDSLIGIGGTIERKKRLESFLKIPEGAFSISYKEGEAYRNSTKERGEEGREIGLVEWRNEKERNEFSKELIQLRDWTMPPKSLLENDTPERRESLGRMLDRVIRFDRPFSKERAVVRYIRNTPIDDKIIIFALQTLTLSRLADFLSEQNYRSLVVTGNTKEKNASLIERFRIDPSIKCILMTLKMGGEGINLPEANYVLVLDDWWNPFILDQAENRVQREGQRKTVHIVYFIMDHTLEIYIMNLMGKKKRMLSDLCLSPFEGEGEEEEEEEDSRVLSEIISEKGSKSLLFDYEVHLIPV